jgi:RING finger family protein
MSHSSLITTDAAALCPYCREPISSSTAVCCELCDTPQHLSCWKEDQQCAIYGCAGMAYKIFARKPDWRIDCILVVIMISLLSVIFAFTGGTPGRLSTMPLPAVISLIAYMYLWSLVFFLSYFWRNASWLLKWLLRKAETNGPAPGAYWTLISGTFIFLLSTLALLGALRVI